MQRVTIIPSDGYVAIDGRAFHDLDLSQIDSQIHAMQWYGMYGEIELAPDVNGQGANIEITSLDTFQPALDAWQAAADAVDNPPPAPPTDYAEAQRMELSMVCRKHITGGTVSKALGTDHTYPTDNTLEHPDQQNLNTCITESLLNADDTSWTVPFWCADSNGIWERRPHNHSQIRSVGSAVAKHIRDAQSRFKALSEQIDTIIANTSLSDDEKRTAIDAVTW